MSHTNKRILIFSLAYHPLEGGAEIATREIVNRLSNIEFDVVTMRFDKTHQKFEVIGRANVYRIGGSYGYLSKVLFVLQAVLFASRRKYDLYWGIMTNMLFPITLMRFLGNRTPYILTLQDGDPFEYVFARLRIKIFLPLLKYGFRHAYKVQAISTFLAEWARRMGYQDKVKIIPNGVDVVKFSGVKYRALNKSDLVLITTSRLVEKNGVGDIIESLKYLPQSIRLNILGAGPLEKSLKLKVESLKLEDRVKFLGNISNDELPRYLHEADIFVRPSLSEGMGISFIEAMAASLPIIGTPMGGIVDFLKDGRTGLLCKVGDPKSIADKIMEYINNPELTSQIILNAKKMVEENYHWDLIVERMKNEIFDPVIAG